MRVREAKDFLVAQAADQARLENVGLSDLEKRMMYYTEGAEATTEDASLNQEFDAQYAADEYEAKISRLLHHALARLSKENPELAQRFREALKSVTKGDHYIEVLWKDEVPTERPPYDKLKVLAAGITVACLFVIAAFSHHRFSPYLPNFLRGSGGFRVIAYSLMAGVCVVYYLLHGRSRE